MAEKKNQAQSVRKNNGYGRLFFYSFCTTFIVLGMIAIALFLNSQDSGLFDFSSRKLYDKARQQVIAKDYEGAEKNLKKCIKKNSGNVDAILLLSDLYEKDSRQDEGIELIKNCIDDSAKNSKNDQLYKRVIQLYVSKGDLPGAVLYTNSLGSYIKSRLDKVRPRTLEVTPSGGSFDRFISVTIEPMENCKVYYTIDGSAPTFESPVYEDNGVIPLTSGDITLRIVAVNSNNLVSEEFVGQYNIKNDNNPYEFKDAKVESIVRALIGKPSGTIYMKDLARVTKLDNTVDGVSDGKIQTFEDLAVMTSISEIKLVGETKVADFEVLQELPALRRLTLKSCNINDLDIKKVLALTNLTYLDLTNNNISEISLIGSLSRLYYLNLSNNDIVDMSSLARLKKLTTLNISGNAVKNIEWIVELKELTSVNLSDNHIKDFMGLADLRLTELTLDDSEISDIKFLTNMKSLKNISLRNNKVSDLLPLKSFSKLETLDVSGNEIVDYSPLATCSNFSILTCSSIPADQESLLADKNVTIVKD